MAVAFHHDILHLPSFIERLSVVIRNIDGLDELSQALKADLRIMCSPATSCVHDKDGVSGWDYLGIDEWVFIKDIVPFDDQESSLRQAPSSERWQLLVL